MFALTIEDSRNCYLMKEVTRAVMAQHTVTISEIGLTSGMETEGKAILYGVQIDVSNG